MSCPEATTPEPGDATAVIPLTRVGDRYTGRRRHDETIPVRHYVAVYGTGFAIWLAALIGGRYAVVHSWWIW